MPTGQENVVDATEKGEPASTALDGLTWPVRTERLSLRRAISEDVETTWPIRRHEAVARWLPNLPSTLDDHRDRFADPGRLAHTLIVELDGQVIGDLMLRVEDAWAQAEVTDQAKGVQAELGWVIAPDHAGKGYATEAVRELLRICFDELRLRRVSAICFADNDASWRLMERLGMRRELHAVRDSLHRSGEWLDSFSYALLAEEWRPRQDSNLRPDH